jgi:hypothetical protein
MQDTLQEYLEDYLHSPKVLSLAELKQIDIPIPAVWEGILQNHDDGARREALLNAWQPFQQELPAVYDLLAKRVTTIELLHHQETVSLLYVLESDGGIRCYEGRNPYQMSMRPIIKKVWHALPEKLRRFYEEFHNGWFDLPSGSLGPIPVERFFFLTEAEWGILDEIEADLSINMETLLTVFTNGAGGYLCIDTDMESNHTEKPQSIIWWDDEPPDLGVDFWQVLDAWMEIGLTT